MPQRKLARAIRAYGIISPILACCGAFPCMSSDPVDPPPGSRLAIQSRVSCAHCEEAIQISLLYELWRMGGDSNPRCLSAHTLSRRAQSTTLSPIQKNLPLPLNPSLGSVKGID